jgi:protein O-GlcNAc transferase
MFKIFGSGASKRSATTDSKTGLEEARTLLEQGRLSEAAAICRKILESQPDHLDSLMLAGEIALREKDLERAMQLYSRITERQPEYAPAHYKRGNLLKDTGRLQAALASYDRAIALDPAHSMALCNRAIVLEGLGQPDAALSSYDRAIAQTPGDALSHCNRAALLQRLGRRAEALAGFDRAIAANPRYPEAHFRRGTLLEESRRLEEALASYDRAIEIAPTFAHAHWRRGAVLRDLGRPDAALASYDKAVGIAPGFSEAHKYRGVLLSETGRPEAALASYGRAIETDPQNAEAYYNRGLILQERQQAEAALADYDKAIALVPHFVEAHLNRGGLLHDRHQLDAALASYERALEFEPRYVEAALSRGIVLFKMKRYPEAIANNARVLELAPDDLSVRLNQMYARLMVCDWPSLPAEAEQIAADVRDDRPLLAGRPLSSPPFPMLALIDEPGLHRSAARIWLRDQIEAKLDKAADAAWIAAGSRARPDRGSGKIHIGYFSSDLRAHPVGYLTAGLFEQHDRTQFEVTGFVFGPEAQDAMVARFHQAFDRFIDVRQKSDREVAGLARELGVDIAIDLNGITDHCRCKIFALRAAPIQINFLGYPGTMSGDFMDYLIADGTVVPRTHQEHYGEKILYLPGCFMPFDSRYGIADRTFTREELGLPRDGFVFCSFNNSIKFTPEVFESWMGILRRTPGSVLWLRRQNPWMSANLQREAARLDVNPERLVFAERMPSLPEHLARLRAADLFLDTFPYNAHATALDALWAGVPLLTRPGRSFASRVAASLLRCAGLPELIVGSPDEYAELAVELAADPARLAQLRRALAERGAPLFDTVRYTKSLEEGYRAVFERHRAGAAPAHINEHLAES